MSSLLAYGHFDVNQGRLIAEAAASAQLEPVLASDPGEAARLLEESPPTAILLSGSDDGSVKMAVQARARSEQRHVPLLAIESEPNDLVFAGALNWGVDDIVPLHTSRELVARLRAIVKAPGPPSAPRRGKAVIGEPEQSRRVALARVLDAAGFEVVFVSNPEEAGAMLEDLRVAVCVLEPSVTGDVGRFCDLAREKGSLARLIFSVVPKDHSSTDGMVRQRDNVRVIDAASPPENAVYVANEMAAPELANKRAAPRELHGTTARFRPEGAEFDDVGFTYNVSSHGMYVRTLAPPVQDVLWLELEPPRTSRRIRLVGEVAWRRPFGPGGHATVPPGFGLKIVDGAARDLQLWKDGCGAPPATSLIARPSPG